MALSERQLKLIREFAKKQVKAGDFRKARHLFNGMSQVRQVHKVNRVHKGCRVNRVHKANRVHKGYRASRVLKVHKVIQGYWVFTQLPLHGK